MRALCIDHRLQRGELMSALCMKDLPVPEPGDRQVRVRIEAAAINVDDQHMAEGTMFGGVPVTPKPTPERPWVPGSEFVGWVDARGDKVSGLEVGTRVYGMRPPKLPGPWAEYGLTKAEFVAPAPEGWGASELASLCLGGTVIASMLAPVGALEGKHCLVVGASGSLGTLLVPVLVRLGARVWGVCSGRNRALVEGLGAERVINYQEGSFGTQLEREGIQVDHTFDFVGGGDTQREGLAVTRKEGCFVTVVGPEAHVGERKLGVLGLAGMFAKVGGRVLASRLSGPRYHFAGPLGPDFDAIDRLIVQPGLRPVIDRTVPLEEAAVREAVSYVASHRARGKVVISAMEPT